MVVTEDTFIRIAKAIIGRVQDRTSLDGEFKALFGVSPVVCLDIWQRSGMVMMKTLEMNQSRTSIKNTRRELVGSVSRQWPW